MKRKKNNKQSIENYSQSILTILKADRKKTFNHKQIAAQLGVNDASSRNQIIKNLHKLAGQKEIEEIERGKFQIVTSTRRSHGIAVVFTNKNLGNESQYDCSRNR